MLGSAAEGADGFSSTGDTSDSNSWASHWDELTVGDAVVAAEISASSSCTSSVGEEEGSSGEACGHAFSMGGGTGPWALTAAEGSEYAAAAASAHGNDVRVTVEGPSDLAASGDFEFCGPPDGDADRGGWTASGCCDLPLSAECAGLGSRRQRGRSSMSSTPPQPRGQFSPLHLLAPEDLREQQTPSMFVLPADLPAELSAEVQLPPPPLAPPSSPALQPTAAPSCCPFCKSFEVDAAHPVADPKSNPRKFARYRQRQVGRKQNRFAAWYRRYGYAGPPYCKACSEKFSSHLLRQNAKSATRRSGPKGRCSRGEPCEACVMILGNFNIAPEELFSNFDLRASSKLSKPKPETTEGTGGETQTVAMGRLLTETDVSQKDRERPGKKRKSIPGMLAALATIVVVWGLTRRFNWGGMSMTADQTSWKCGAEMNSLVDEALMHSVCAGADAGKTFACSVNECAAAGKMPIGERICRCDGCYQPGRCGGWVLQGHSAGSELETGRECQRFEVSPRPQETRLNWRLPKDIDCRWCKRFAAQEGAQAKCGDNLRERPEHKLDHIGTPIGRTSSCELSAVYAWPQPVAGPEEVAPTYESSPPKVREGVLWSAGGDGAATLWLYNILTPAEVVPPGFPEWIESSDMHSMWKFEPADGVWLPQNYSIGSAPHPTSLSGTATWADKNGSLFVFGGQPTSIRAQTPHAHRNSIVWMWRYDTNEHKWEPLGPRSTATQAQDSGAPIPPRRLQVVEQLSGYIMPAWPANRVRAAIWVDHSLESSDVGAVWMFGGTGVGGDLPETCSDSNCSWLPIETGTSELWQYRYEYHATLYGTSQSLRSKTVSGEWQLVCTDPVRSGTRGPADYGPDGTRQCPEGRVDAGSWSSTSGGWIFGGTAISLFDDANLGQLRDLWQFSAVRVTSPSDQVATIAGSWRQVLPDAQAQLADMVWPPAWSAPRGWVDKQGGGSLWISGETGQQHDVVPVCFRSSDGTQDCSPTATIGEVDGDSSKLHSDLWRFDFSSAQWEHIHASAGFGSPGQAAWHIPRPAQRQRAVLSVASSNSADSGAPDVFMLGGIGTQECSDGGSDDDYREGEIGGDPVQLLDTTAGGLTGLWRWEETYGESRYPR